MKEKIVHLGETKECSYPGCRLEGHLRHNILITNELPNAAELPFCHYHYFIVSANHFTCRKIGEWKFVLEGNFELVEQIESVIAAVKMREAETKSLNTSNV